MSAAAAASRTGRLAYQVAASVKPVPVTALPRRGAAGGGPSGPSPPPPQALPRGVPHQPTLADGTHDHRRLDREQDDHSPAPRSAPHPLHRPRRRRGELIDVPPGTLSQPTETPSPLLGQRPRVERRRVAMVLAATETTSTPKISTRAPVHALACWAGNGDRESVNISSVSEDSGPPQPVQGTSNWLPNAVRSSGAVSLAALATARSAPVTMPGRAVGRTTETIARHLRTPRAREASRRWSGTSRRASSDVRTMSGSMRIPRARQPAQAEKEGVSRTITGNTKMPTKIDGIPVITSAKNRTGVASSPLVRYSDRYTAAKTPTGTATTVPRATILIVPLMPAPYPPPAAVATNGAGWVKKLQDSRP